MPIIVRDYSGKESRPVLIAMMIHSGVLGRIASITKGHENLFGGKWADLIAGWCLDYWRKYGKAPGKALLPIFQDWALQCKDNGAVELVESMLEGLGKEASRSEDLNEDFIVDLAARYFDGAQLNRIQGEMDEALRQKDIDQAREVLLSYKRIQLGSSGEIQVDAESIARSLLNREKNQVVIWPKDLGKFLSPHFSRDRFISFVGPEKRGKSYWLQETVWQALRQRRRVRYYVVGDMSEDEVIQRLMVRSSRRPLDAKSIKIPRDLQIIKEGADRKPKVESEVYDSGEVTLKGRILDWEKIAGKRGGLLSLQCRSAHSITAGEIENELRHLDPEDVPDVVVIDYADLLAPEPHTVKMDFRHQVNMTWALLRSISQKYHLLLVTATQAAATSYDRKLITKKDFSEDKRKNAHVTGMIGINQTAEEKVHGIYRLNWVFLRDGKWADFQVVWTAGNLAVGCPCFVSKLP